MKLFSLIVLLFIPEISDAQPGIETIRGKAVAPDRYEGIKGSPYLFDQFVNATIIQSSGNPIEDVLINFNGFTQNFEAHTGKEIIEVELGYFIGLKLEKQDSICGRQSFLKFDHPKLFNKYPLFIFLGTKHRLLKDFHVSLADHKVQSPGKPQQYSGFAAFSNYYLVTGQEIEWIKLNEKEILKKLKVPGIEEFITTNAVDLTTESGLCQLLKWLDKK